MSTELDEMIDEAATEIIDGWDQKDRTALARIVVPKLLRYKGSHPTAVRAQAKVVSGEALDARELNSADKAMYD